MNGNSSAAFSSVSLRSLREAPRSPTRMFSATVRPGKRAPPSGTYDSPRRARAWRARRLTSSPSSTIDPGLVGTTPAMAAASVDLPAPLVPRMAHTVPAGTSMDTFRSAGRAP